MVADRIKKLVNTNEMSVQTWSEIVPDVGLYNDYMGYFLLMIVGILLLAMGFGIVNTMLMAVLEILCWK